MPAAVGYIFRSREPISRVGRGAFARIWRKEWYIEPTIAH
jgi:hypothetical protein